MILRRPIKAPVTSSKTSRLFVTTVLAGNCDAIGRNHMVIAGTLIFQLLEGIRHTTVPKCHEHPHQVFWPLKNFQLQISMTTKVHRKHTHQHHIGNLLFPTSQARRIGWIKEACASPCLGDTNRHQSHPYLLALLFCMASWYVTNDLE